MWVLGGRSVGEGQGVSWGWVIKLSQLMLGSAMSGGSAGTGRRVRRTSGVGELIVCGSAAGQGPV